MKKVLKFLGLLVFATLLAAGVSVWLLLRPAGLAFVTPWLNRQLSEASGMEARIEGLRWVYPLGMKFEALHLDGEEGTGLEIRNFYTRVSSRRLWRRQLHVYSFRAETAAFRGWPPGEGDRPEPEAPDGFGGLPDLKTLFERVVVEELSFPEIRLLPPFREEAVTARLEGRFVDGRLELSAEAAGEALPPMEGRLLVLRGESGEREQILQAELDLGIGEGRVRFEGEVTGASVNVGAEILALPLELLGLAGVTDAGASVEGRLEVTGTLSEPEVTLRTAFTGLKPGDPDLWEGPPAALRIEGTLGGGRGKLRLRIEDLPGEPVRLDLDVPLRMALYPFSLEVSGDEPMEGALTSSTDLEGLSRLFVLDVFHRLSGRLDVDVRLGGTPEAPEVRGGAQVVDGAYEHTLTGLHLRDLELSVSAGRDAVRLDHFQARDGREGRVIMDGEVVLNPDRELRFAAEVTLQNFQAVRQDELDAVVNGSLRWSGDRSESRMEGQLALRPVEIRIPETLPHTVRTIEVTERFEDAREEEREPERAPARHRLNLDLTLVSPDRIFVRGRGLDSEWSARLRMEGHARDPVLTGELAILRGRFLFFGKRLVITRGRVLFDGAFPPEPALDVEAELRSGGILGVVRVTGPASDPDIELDSTPPLPEDEILARLLFGRESARITPWQALTLARALNSLRGGGSAFDVMGTTRRMLQVDQIEIRSDEEQEGQTRVAVGRHVGDRIYVELERGVEAESGRARVEVELTPTLRLETQTGVDADSGVGLRWRWDY